MNTSTDLLANAHHIHIVGIGGIGFSAIARVLLARGLRVSGSDAAPGPLTAGLQRAGAVIYAGHRAENLSADVDLVLVTSAVSGDNPEVDAARVRGIPVLRRREFLTELTAGYRTLAVAGSHGKTTTTALLGLMLADADLDPTVIVGGIVPEWGSNARAGRGEYLVVEADEYDRAFLGLTPLLAVVTNVDYDHPDIFPTRADYRQAFAEFMRRVPGEGTLLVGGDDANASDLTEGARAPVVRYGAGETNVWRARDMEPSASGGSHFRVFHANEFVGDFQVRLPGRHNVLNALGALAAAQRAGVSFDSARVTLARFGGAERRFQVRGEAGGITVVDDYAHHPAEIRATLAAARRVFAGREVWAVFQPHTFSRTRALLEEFARSFDDADHVVVAEVYAARERDSLGVGGRDIVARMRHHDTRFIATLDEVLKYLLSSVAPGAVLITLGAGDVNQVGARFLEARNDARIRI